VEYVIVNTKRKPWRYYTGTGFSDADTSSDAPEALKFDGIVAACVALRSRPDLYFVGWHVDIAKAHGA
jgi:hypothetical protein